MSLTRSRSGPQMLLAHTACKLDTLVSLGIVVLILALSVILSLLKPRKAAKLEAGNANV